MDDVARLPAQDRADLFAAVAGRRAFNVTIVEKDFWVCWTLKRLFTLANPPAGLIFKGGTSLSKVFGAIERFSEDVEISFDRADLGFGGDQDPLQAPTKKKQQAAIAKLKAACQTMIRGDLLPKLNVAFAEALQLPAGDNWRIELDDNDEDQATLLFHYPVISRSQTSDLVYVRPAVRLEMGARGEHWPSVDAEVQSHSAEEFPQFFKLPRTAVKVVTAERTFWEKATILHMWCQAEPSKKLGDRQSRHYYDVVRLYERGIGEKALQDLDLLRAVSRHKTVFFARAWAKFHEAVPGTLRLVPPAGRILDLERDYQRMRQEMIFGESPPLDRILDVLRTIEQRVNSA